MFTISTNQGDASILDSAPLTGQTRRRGKNERFKVANHTQAANARRTSTAYKRERERERERKRERERERATALRAPLLAFERLTLLTIAIARVRAALNALHTLMLNIL